MWTERLHAEDYLEFLRRLLQGMWEIKNGEYVYRWYKPPEQREAVKAPSETVDVEAIKKASEGAIRMANRAAKVAESMAHEAANTVAAQLH